MEIVFGLAAMVLGGMAVAAFNYRKAWERLGGFPLTFITMLSGHMSAMVLGIAVGRWYPPAKAAGTMLLAISCALFLLGCAVAYAFFNWLAQDD